MITKEEMIKKIEKILIENDCSIGMALKVGNFIKHNWETSRDAILKMQKEGKILKSLNSENIKDFIKTVEDKLNIKTGGE